MSPRYRIAAVGTGIRRGFLRVHFHAVAGDLFVNMTQEIPIKRLRATPLGRIDGWAALCSLLANLVARDMTDERIDAAIASSRSKAVAR
jgi:hypothetical protein